MLALVDRALLRNQAYIEGSFVGEPVTPVTNPATGLEIARVPALGQPEVRRSIEAAAAALTDWAGLTGKGRSAVLRRWFALIVQARSDLAAILTSEQGKPYQEALAEIDYAASYVEFYAEEAKRITGEILGSHRAGTHLLVMREPVGVVAAITPWNFPAAMVTRKLAPAMAAGCTVVLKPAPETPLTALALAELAERAGVPAGVLNVVTGDAAMIGDILTSHPTVRMLTFTGSTRVGKLLMAQCSTTVKKVALELGGNAPFIVFGDADLDAAVEGAMQSKFRNAGQTCVCTNRFYVQHEVHDSFIDMLTDRINALRVGDGHNPSTDLGPLINDNALRKVELHVVDALGKGARLRAGGRRHPLGGTYFEPTLLTEVHSGMLVCAEETFGPLAAVVSFETEDEVIEAANATPFGLAAYVYTADVKRSFRMIGALRYGMVGLNTGLISTELAPFGGVKESGNSREGSSHGLLEFTELKYACIDAS